MGQHPGYVPWATTWLSPRHHKQRRNDVTPQIENTYFITSEHHWSLIKANKTKQPQSLQSRKSVKPCKSELCRSHAWSVQDKNLILSERLFPVLWSLMVVICYGGYFFWLVVSGKIWEVSLFLFFLFVGLVCLIFALWSLFSSRLLGLGRSPLIAMTTRNQFRSFREPPNARL